MTPVYFGPQSFPDENRAVGDFVSRICFGAPGGFADFCTMGVFDRGHLVAGTVYHNWHPECGAIELSSASSTRRWLARPVVKAMFALPFDRLGCRIVALRVSEHNATMRGIARRFGFHETIIPRLRGDDEAECIYTLHRDDWAAHPMNR